MSQEKFLLKPASSLLLITLLGVLPLCLPAQRLAEFTGKAGTLKADKNLLSITAGNIHVGLTVYSPTVIRVKYSRGSFDARSSWAVIREAEEGSLLYRDYGDSASVTTDSMEVMIYKTPLRFAFRNKQGALLSVDQPGMPVCWLGTEVTCYRKLFADEKFLGLGEKTGNLDKRGSSYVNWNSDVPAYAVNHDPLYQSIPFFIGIHGKCTYGIFLDNSFRTKFNFGASTDEEFSSFSAADGDLDYYFFGASTVAGVISDYTWLTGRPPLPPYWSLGYQQCRWSYFPESQVMGIAQTFRDKQIPCDVIYLDIDYMDKYKIFTWNRQHFPDPKAMIGKLNTMGFHVVTIVDPGIRIDKDYFAYNEGLAAGYFAKYPGGKNYTGSVWPGRCHFPDFTSSKVRQWWGESFVHLTEPGVEGFWNDMNEPSAWGQSIPDIVQFDFEGRKGSMAEAHNIYGLQMAKATYEGTRKLLNGKRPFTLTRAGYAGIQRYSAVWTGDNDATDEHMLLSARMVTGLGLSGVSFAGPDVGGFMGNPSEKLYLRWMSMGAYTPFFRNHSAWETRSKEPWAFGVNAERSVKKMIEGRYRLLPYIYSMFYESTRSGLPVARSLAIPYTFDEKVYWWKYQNQYMFGDNLLVAPVSCEQMAAKIYLPEGGWYRFSTGEYHEGGREVTVESPIDDLPVFVKASGILLMQPLIRHTGEDPGKTIDLCIYRGEARNRFTWYQDDGTTYGYEKGDFHLRIIEYDPDGRYIRIGAPEGSIPSKFNAVRLVLHGFESPAVLKINGEERQTKPRSATESFVEFPLPAESVSIIW